ncbi:hypothetical protein GH714_015465 [Hevea brasiliensis]|uniref:Retrotransposon gag domain-containing protein n=1 Tax=Hevea brasiliensis TaxID=3981 RepID=A0A6A6M943_HEVBR|nr:hypothetical protein GH714_015465 [Hevea brasiliensis]
MPNTRMDSRVDAIERSLGALEEGLVRMAGNGSRMRESSSNQRGDESSFGSGLYGRCCITLGRWLKQRSPNMTWEQLSVELLQRFGGDAFASPYERLAAVRQDGSVDDFIDEFVARAAQVPGITDQFYIGFFLNGLKAEIRVRIRSQDTGDIFRLMTLAREVERELLHTGMTKIEKSPDAGERWSFGSGPSYKAGGMGFSKQVQQQFKAQTDWVGANKEKVQSRVGNIARKNPKIASSTINAKQESAAILQQK